ncbi:MAG: beta-L-arabinofuranosidase domain-containing protein [Mangrovibacterium sp.]
MYLSLKHQVLALLLALITLGSCTEKKESLKAFHLSDVELLDSPFKDAMNADMKYILAMDMDRLLAPYLKEAGLPPKADNYTNWENTGLDGHIGGHYISALSKMYAATGDAQMLERLQYMLSELKRAQDANGDGYLSGVPNGKAIWAEIKGGNIDAGSFSLNKRWVPLYNIHKIYAGLYDAYLYTGNEQAKDMLIQLTDWAIDLVSNLSEDQIQDMLRSEHGGLNEVFAHVAALTKEDKYLQLAEKFSQKSIVEPLAKHEDHLTGMHANTQIPKIIGFKQVAEVNGNDAWHDAADFFWHNVVNHRSVCIGGNSVREHFHPIDDYSSMIESEQGPETCNTYNMLKLTRQLFLSNPNSEYMDYYERALYNHILSTEDPEDGGFVYFTSMRPGHYRIYSQPETSFWCCVGSGLENHTQYGDLIYAHTDHDLYVNLFIPSVLNWEEKGITLTQETYFPFTEKTTLTINAAQKTKYNLYIRYPKWVNNGTLNASVNGHIQKVKQNDNSYFCITRTWKDGDQVEITLPMHTTTEQLPDGENYHAFLHGPIVLAASMGTEHQGGLLADDSRGGHIAADIKYPLQEMPTLIASTNELANLAKPIAGEPLSFELENVQPASYQHLQLVPFFQLHKTRYAIYFKSATPEEYEAEKEAIAQAEAEKKALEEATIDAVYPGEQQPESDHFIKSEKSNAGVNQGKHWRDASGWFSYELRYNNQTASHLRIMYFAGDDNRHFTLWVNNSKIADISLSRKEGNGFYTVDYTIPAAILEKAKGKLIVKFEAQPHSVAGGIYEVRLMK